MSSSDNSADSNSPDIGEIIHEFEIAWQKGNQPEIEDYCLPDNRELLIELVHIDLERRIKQCQQVKVEIYLTRFSELTEDEEVVLELVAAEIRLCQNVGSFSTLDSYLQRFPNLADKLRQLTQGKTERLKPAAPTHLQIRCPHCKNSVELIDESPEVLVECPSCGSSFSLYGEDTTPDLTQRKTVGRFVLLERLGVGSFGTVWKARDDELHRTVAVKIPRKGELEESEVDQFLREARAAAQLQHPNIVSVHEIGRDEDLPYIVSDLIEGATLAEWAEVRQPTARESATLCATIATALQHAHENGVVHRDLKPANVMIDLEGRPHIMDFGLAKRDAGEITMTLEGRILGTPAYMSPEQARGDGHQADRRSDVYSLGVMLYQLLTGELPFRGSTRMLIVQILHDDPPSLRKLDSNVPRDLDVICQKCLEKDPAKRYSSAEDLAADLQHYLDGKPIQARPTSQLSRLWRWSRRHPARAGLVASISLFLTTLAVCGPVIAVMQSRLVRQEKTRAQEESKLRAESQQNLTRSLAAQSKATLSSNPVRGVLLAVEAIRTWKDEEGLPLSQAEEALRIALDRNTGVILSRQDKGIYSVSMSKDGRWTLMADAVATQLLDLQSEDPETTKTRYAREKGVPSTQFVNGGKRMVVCTKTSIQIWELGRGPRLVSSIPIRMDLSGERDFYSIVLSPNGQWLVFTGSVWHKSTRSWSSTSRVWNIGEENPTEHRLRIDGKQDAFRRFFFASENQRLVTATSTIGSKRDPAFRSTTFQIWDLAERVIDHQPIAEFTGPAGQVAKAFLAHAGRLLVTYEDHTETGVFETVLRDLTAKVPKLVLSHVGGTPIISPDGQWLTMSHGKKVLLWDLSHVGDTNVPRTFTSHSEPVGSLIFSPSSKYLFSASYSETYVWRCDSKEGQPYAMSLIGRHDEGQRTRFVEGPMLAISSDRQWLQRRDGSRHIDVWILPIEKKRPSASSYPAFMDGHTQMTHIRARAGAPIVETAIAPQGTLFGVDVNGTVRTWQLNRDNSLTDARSQQSFLMTVPRSYDGRVGWRSPSSGLAFSANGRWLVATSVSSNGSAWDTRSTPGKQVLKGNVTLSPNRRWLISGENLYDLDSAEPLSRPQRIETGDSELASIGVTDDLRWLMREVIRDTTVAGSPSRKSGGGMGQGSATGGFGTGFTRGFELLRTSRIADSMSLQSRGNSELSGTVIIGGRWIVSVGDQSIQFWNTAADQPLRTKQNLALRPNYRFLNGSAIAASREWLVVGTAFQPAGFGGYTSATTAGDGAWVFNLGSADPKRTKRVVCEGEHIRAVALNGDGRLLATASDSEISTFGRLPTGSAVQQIRVWEANKTSASHVFQFEAENSVTKERTPINALALSPDGRWLAVSTPKATWILDLRSKTTDGARRMLVERSFNRMAFSPDGRLFAGEGWSGVELHHLKIPALIENARQSAGRNLTKAEWHTLYGTTPYRRTFADLPDGD